MKSTTKVRLLILAMSTVSVVSMVGSTAATVAWYVNSIGAKVTYTGTSVQKSTRLTLGLVDEEHRFSDEDLVTYNLEKESGATVDGKTILWSKSSSIINDVLTAYLTKYGYATYLLSPVTTKARAIDSTDNLTLYKAPEATQTVLDETADPRTYITLPFAFKIVNSSNEKVENKEIWLTNSMITTSLANNDGNNVIRLFVDNHHSSEKFIVRPADNSDSTGETVVGGLLNLSGGNSTVYDYAQGEMKEYVYGDYDKSGGFAPIYSDSTYEFFPGYDEDEYDNVNDTPYETASTFYAKHNKDCHPITNYNELKNRFLKAEYQTMGTIKPTSTNGVYSGGKPIAYTESASKIGYSTISIYVEGWDHSLTDDKIGVEFNLSMTFEINTL